MAKEDHYSLKTGHFLRGIAEETKQEFARQFGTEVPFHRPDAYLLRRSMRRISKDGRTQKGTK